MDSQIQEATTLLCDRLKEVMSRKGFQFETELARYLGTPRETLRRYFKPRSSKSRLSLPSPETLAKIRKKVPEITDDDAAIIGTAYSRILSQAHSLGNEVRFGGKPKESLPTEASLNEHRRPMLDPTDDKDATIGRRVRQVVAEVMDGKSMTIGSFSPVDLLSQLGDRYQIGDMPAILTKHNFATINVSSWTQSDKHNFLGYLNFALEEARKAMSLLAQFKPDDMRDDLLQKAGRNADLLWRTYKVASSVAPMEYVNDIDLTRKCRVLNSQSSPSTKGEQS